MKKYLVLGLGKTGASFFQLLKKKGWEGVGFDTRKNIPIPLEVGTSACYFESLPGSIWPEISGVMVSPGFDLNHPLVLEAKKQNKSIEGDIEFFYRDAKAPIIAITGTNAKSTVTSLVTQMIQASGKKVLMGGNIGTPALDLLNLPTPDYYVLELSSFQLDLVSTFCAEIAVILNFSPDHLERHGTLAAYQHAKERIYWHCPFPVLNRRYVPTQPIHAVSSFGLDLPTADSLALACSNPEKWAASAWGIIPDELDSNIRWIGQGGQKIMHVSALSPDLSGEHNLENALSALSITAPLQLPLAPQLEVLRHFRGLPHRCTFVAEHQGVKWYNDSKGTNVGASLAAIQGLAKNIQGKLILLLGGQAKNQDFTPLRALLLQYARAVIVFGIDGEQIKAHLPGLPLYEVTDSCFSSVLNKAKNLAEKGDIVLLSPACASQDMFQNYEDRGLQFETWVKQQGMRDSIVKGLNTPLSECDGVLDW